MVDVEGGLEVVDVEGTIDGLPHEQHMRTLNRWHIGCAMINNNIISLHFYLTLHLQ